MRPLVHLSVLCIRLRERAIQRGGHCLAPDFRNVSRLAYEQQKQHILLDWSTPPARAPPPFFLKARSGVTFKVLYQYGRQYNEGSTTPGENKNHFDSLAFMSTKVERVWSTRPPFFFFNNAYLGLTTPSNSTSERITYLFWHDQVEKVSSIFSENLLPSKTHDPRPARSFENCFGCCEELKRKKKRVGVWWTHIFSCVSAFYQR